MQISIVGVSAPEQRVSEKGTKYSMLSLAYKADGKLQEKKLMSFNKDAYNVLKNASPGEVYEVNSEKKGQYWEWLGAQKVDGTSVSTTPTAPKAAGGGAQPARTGTWETPEERAIKQVYIARSVALAQALIKNPKGDMKTVLADAKAFEGWLLRDLDDLAVAPNTDELDDGPKVLDNDVE